MSSEKIKGVIFEKIIKKKLKYCFSEEIDFRLTYIAGAFPACVEHSELRWTHTPQRGSKTGTKQVEHSAT